MARNVIKSDFRAKWPPAAIFMSKILKNKSIYLKWRDKNGETDFRASKMAVTGHFVNKFNRKSIYLKWWDMRAKVIFEHPTWPPAPILWKQKLCILIWNGEKCDIKLFSGIQNGRRRPFCEVMFKEIKVAYWSEMAINAIKSDFRPPK